MGFNRALTLASEPHCAFAAGAVMDASKSIPKAIVNDLKIAFICSQRLRGNNGRQVLKKWIISPL
jgi:hypothetical protein